MGAHNIKVYSTPTCPYCIRVKQYLDAKGITYQNIDVSADAQAAQEMMEISSQMGVPVISVDGQAVVGFDKDRLEQLLA